MRYHYVPARLTREGAYALVNIDQKKDLALGIVTRQGPREVIQAVGRYYLIPKTQTAEVAFVVREDMRGQGFGQILVQRIIHMARQRKLEKLLAVVQSDNQAVRHLLEKSGFVVEPETDNPGFATLALAL